VPVALEYREQQSVAISWISPQMAQKSLTPVAGFYMRYFGPGLTQMTFAAMHLEVLEAFANFLAAAG
jgi:hypothetical protein